MKISCTKNNLQAGLAATCHLSTKNLQLPILNNVLVVAKNGNIRLTSTNLETAVSCLVRGKVEEEGEITIPAKLFFDFISLLSEEKIELICKDQLLVIETSDHKTKINGLPASDFPLVPAVKTEKNFLLPANLLFSALSQTVFAAASNEARPELSGVYFHFFNNELTLAATDSYRLAERKIKITSGPETETTVIVPARTIVEINRIISLFKDVNEITAGVQIGLSENQIVFSFGPVELISRVIEGNFPDYHQIVPKTFKTETELNRDDFISGIKAASLFSRSGLFDVTLKFDPAGAVNALAADTNRGENDVAIKAAVSGEENSVTINYRYLLDGLNSMNSDKVVFQMVDGANPCLVRPVTSNQDHFYIVMPIRQ
ncbi:MAG: DNA polymerase III subunit beta [Candidatus Uhrbacteria bacterium]